MRGAQNGCNGFPARRSRMPWGVNVMEKNPVLEVKNKMSFDLEEKVNNFLGFFYYFGHDLSCRLDLVQKTTVPG